MTEHEQLRELIPIYALGATTTDESVDVEAHVQNCNDCRDELVIHLTTASALEGRSDPPSGIWPKILERVDESHAAEVVYLAERRSRKITTYLISVAAAVALVLGGALLPRLIEDDLIGATDVVAAANEAATQPGSVVADFLVEQESIARLVLTPEGQGFIIPTAQLPALDESRTYQLWVINTDEAVISAGVLGSRPTPSMFTWSGEVAGLALTREVAGGVVSSEGDVVSVVTDL